MNIELDELQKIAQQLDYFMRDYGNSKALEVAAEAIAEEIGNRDYTITRVCVTQQWYVDVKHRRDALESDVLYAAEEWTQYGDEYGEVDKEIIKEDVCGDDYDTEVDS